MPITPPIHLPSHYHPSKPTFFAPPINWLCNACLNGRLCLTDRMPAAAAAVAVRSPPPTLSHLTHTHPTRLRADFPPPRPDSAAPGSRTCQRPSQPAQCPTGSKSRHQPGGGVGGPLGCRVLNHWTVGGLNSWAIWAIGLSVGCIW